MIFEKFLIVSPSEDGSVDKLTGIELLKLLNEIVLVPTPPSK